MQAFCSSRSVSFSFLSLILAFTIVFSSCAHKQPNLTPAQQSQLNLYTALAEVQETNLAVTKTFIALNQNGQAPTDITRTALDFTRQVTNTVSTGTQILDSSQPATAKAQAVLALIGKLDLPPALKAFAASSTTNQAIIGGINAVLGVQKAILTIKAANVATVSVAKPAVAQ